MSSLSKRWVYGHLSVLGWEAMPNKEDDAEMNLIT
jgi:hypothetical protein